MKCLLIAGIVLATSIVATAISAESDRLAVRSKAWQTLLEREAFQFYESDASMLFSLSQYGGSCQIHMIYDPKWSAMTFKFERDGKELLTIRGHMRSVFRTEKNVLYFAQFPKASSGCVVTSHDLDTGEKLWETKLSAVGKVGHSVYLNEVTIGLWSLTGPDSEGEGTVSITGRESYGDYIEILDRKTGTILAHKMYRQGYGK